MTALLNKVNRSEFIEELRGLERLEVVETLISNASLFERGSR